MESAEVAGTHPKERWEPEVPSVGASTPRFILKTWNCFGAAQSVAAFLRWKGAPDAHRFDVEALHTAVHEVDILCLQEVFLSDAESFFARLSYEHKVRDHNATTLWPLTFGGSGLAIASKFPILRHTTRGFTRPHVGVERFARKGMLHARIALDTTTEIDVVTTHMQAGYGPAEARVRKRQLSEVRALVDEVGDARRPMIVCGDLNIDGLSAARHAEYAAIREILADFDDVGATDDHATFHPDVEINELAFRYESTGPRQRLDYVLFRPGAERGVRPFHCSLALSEPYHLPEGRTFASDHFAVRVEFERVDIAPR